MTDHLVSVDDKKEKIKGDMEGINEGVPEEDATENIGIKIDEEKRLLAFELRHLNKERYLIIYSYLITYFHCVYKAEDIVGILLSYLHYLSNLHESYPLTKYLQQYFILGYLLCLTKCSSTLY